MRTIKFRGYNKKNGKWLYGYYLRNRGVDFVCPDEFATPEKDWTDYEVDPATVGQFTGLHDKNGKEIYEGDIVQWGDSEHKIKQVVEFRNGAFGYVYDTIGSFVPYAANTNFDFAALGTDKRFEVVGNVFDDHLNGGDHEPLDR